jgi:hypothetical protein
MNFEAFKGGIRDPEVKIDDAFPIFIFRTGLLNI